MRTVVLSGSLGASGAMWSGQVAVLERAGLRVVRVDHPGHGDTSPAAVRDIADLARHVLAHVDAERFSLVGLSLGGAVGMRLALDAPERVERLVLACTSARFGEPATWLERAALVRARGVEAVAETVVARWFTPRFADVRRYRRMLVATDGESYARCCEALARWDVRGELARVRAPTLAIAAADDPSTPPDHLERIAAEIAGARLAVIPNARHLANVERPDEFDRLLLEHLA